MATCVAFPAVAVTVTVASPTGVPGSLGPPLPPPFPPPPPQPPIVIRSATTKTENSLPNFRRFDPPPSKNAPNRVAPRVVPHHPELSNFATCAAVVDTVTVVDPLPVTDAD